MNVQWSEYPLIKEINMAMSTKVLTYMAVCIAIKNHTNISVATTDGLGRSVDVTHLGKYTEYSVQVFAFFGNSTNETLPNRNDTIRGSENITIRTIEDGEIPMSQ
jgi:hypothetical protein